MKINYTLSKIGKYLGIIKNESKEEISSSLSDFFETPTPDKVRIYDLNEGRNVLREVDNLFPQKYSIEQAIKDTYSRIYQEGNGKGVQFSLSIYNNGELNDNIVIPAGSLEALMDLPQEQVASVSEHHNCDDLYQPKFLATYYDHEKLVAVKLFYAPESVSVNTVLEAAKISPLNRPEHKRNPDYKHPLNGDVKQLLAA